MPRPPPTPPRTQAVGEYSSDAMRVALADAGDAMDDANYEHTTANAAILRLTKELAWIGAWVCGRGCRSCWGERVRALGGKGKPKRRCAALRRILM